MKRPLIISSIAHVVVLAWGLVAFAARPSEAPQAEPLPVEFVSATEFSQMTAGVKNAPKAIEDPKPLVDKIGDAKPVKELAPKVADKPEIKTDSKPAAESKPEPKTESKAAEKTEKPKDSKPKTDQIADELKKDESKKPPKKPPEFKPDQIAAQLKKDEAKKPAPKYDANQIAALLDHREPQRQVSTGATLNGVAALGTPAGSAAHLSQSELDALRAKLISLWNPPPAVSSNPDQYVVTIRIRLTRDHRLDGQPEVISSGEGPLFEATRDSAMRAVLQAQPYDMLSPATYDLWKDITLTFNPREVFGG
jgi:colicin import membrane protein